MKINMFNPAITPFKGRREDRNTVQQLRQNNDYSLSENNQIKINKAIDNLAKESGEKNVKFLIDVADGLQYGTNIDLGKEAKNDWKSKLHDAAKQSLSISNPIVQNKYASEMKRVFHTEKTLNEDEMAILKSRENILLQLDKSQLADEKNPNIQRVESNLDYFIASSEVPTKQKKYVLNRLDYFLSPDYQINPQLENKKTKVFAEMINDLVVDTKESKVPNTKAINQKHHGMCAAISIARKLLSYEDKPNYVDSIMSELDASPNLMVYDKTRIGQHVKVPVEKAFVDFDDAEKKGYRIVDASTTQWMNVAQMYGAENTPMATFIPFDKENFGAFNDSSNMIPINDKNLETKHRYYQSLLKAEETIGSAKKFNLETKLKTKSRSESAFSDMKYLQKVNANMQNTLKDTVPSLSDKESHFFVSKLIGLNVKNSEAINKVKDGTAKYHFIPNEETSMKDKKVKAFILDTFKDKVDVDKLDKNVPIIRDNIEVSNRLQSDMQPTHPQSTHVTKARKLYEAAAAYRNSVISSIDDYDYRTDKMIELNIPDNETLLSKNMENVIKHVEKTGDKNYVQHFSASLGIEPTKEATVELLTGLKQGVDDISTRQLDELYFLLGMGSRKEALLNELSGARMAMEQNDTDKIHQASFSLGWKKDDKANAIKEYEKFEKVLSNNPTDEQYVEIFNKAGFKNQIQAYADIFQIVVNAFNTPEDEVSSHIINNFNQANGIPEGTPLIESKKQLEQVGNAFNQVSSSITFVRSIMDVSDENGTPVNTAQAGNIVIEKLENNGAIIPAKELIPLRDRFDAIDKLKSQDEFSSRQGKISDPKLYKLSKAEKETLKKIDKSINKMYSEVNKELAFSLREIRKPLEDHARKIGIETGHYWVPKDGHSGLYKPQQVKIIEQMTDRQYHATGDFDKIIEAVKETPYSAVSGTSVFHDRMGGHAQYIAEISPAGPNNKDVLYHDNSWGASELENVWTDSEGLTRTDYSDIRGGDLGYITNDKWRNGNYVENLRYKRGEVSPEKIENKQLRKLSGYDGEGYKFPLIMDSVVQGSDGAHGRLAATIKDNIFLPDMAFLGELQELAKGMTKDEIKAAIKRNQTAGQGYRKVVDDIEKRIETTNFHKGIDSEEDYNALADNDPVKVNFEKAALTRSFPDGVEWKDLAKARTVQDVKAFESVRDKNARMYFDYSFAKSNHSLVHYEFSNNNLNGKLSNIVDSAIKNNNLNPDQKLLQKLKGGLYHPVDKEFDGSLKNSIKFMVDGVIKKFDEVVEESPARENAKAEIRENLTKTLADDLYINESDVNNTSTKFKAIAKYIDNKYNPQTDEDFVNAYRRLQDMTTEEFKKETADVKPEDMGIKPFTGYEMLRRYKAQDEKTQNTLANVVYQSEVLDTIKLSDATTTYKHQKLYKRVQGVIYDKGRTFDDLYRDYSFTLQNLEFEKMFNKYKGRNYENYGAFPAYPKISIINDDLFEHKIDVIDQSTYNIMSKVSNMQSNLKIYDMVDSLNDTINMIPDNSKATKKQQAKINRIAGEFVTHTFNDDTIVASNEAAVALLSMDKSATGKDYKAVFAPMKEQIDTIQKTASREFLQQGIGAALHGLNSQFDTLINADIPDKFKNRVKEDVANWINEELKVNKPNPTEAKMKKLNSSLDNYSVGKKNFGITKMVYMDTIQQELDALKATNVGIISKQRMSEMLTAKAGEVTAKVNTTMVPEQYRDSFSNTIFTLVASPEKLDKQMVDDVIVNSFKIFSDIDKETLLANKNIKQLSSAIIALNKNETAVGPKYADNFNKRLDNINTATKKFVQGNVRPEYHNAVYSQVTGIVESNLKDHKSKYNQEKAALAHDKFVEDLKKYHYLNNPQDLLNEYLLLSAKDSKLNSLPKDKVKNSNEAAEYEATERSLGIAMEHASIMEMQLTLMNAVDSGNAAGVTEKFKNYDVVVSNDKGWSTVPMDSDKAIDYMVKSLSVGDNIETCVMFINKLGLADKFIKMQNKEFSVKDAKTNTRHIINTLNTTSAQVNIAKSELQKLAANGIEKDENYADRIDEAKLSIIEQTKKMTRKKAVQQILYSLDDAKMLIGSNPNIPKMIIINQSVNATLAGITKKAQDDVSFAQKKLDAYDSIHSLVNTITVPEYSPAFKEKEIFNAKFSEYEEFSAKALAKAAEDASSVFEIERS